MKTRFILFYLLSLTVATTSITSNKAETTSFDVYSSKYRDCFDIVNSLLVQGILSRSRLHEFYPEMYERIVELETLHSYWIENKRYAEVFRMYSFYYDYSKTVLSLREMLESRYKNPIYDDYSNQLISMLELFFEIIQFFNYRGEFVGGIRMWLENRLNILQELEKKDDWFAKRPKGDINEHSKLLDALNRLKKYFMIADQCLVNAVKPDSLNSKWAEDMKFYKFEEQYMEFHEAMRHWFSKANLNLSNISSDASKLVSKRKQILESAKAWSLNQRFKDIEDQVRFFQQFSSLFSKLVMITDSKFILKTQFACLPSVLQFQLMFVNFYDHRGNKLISSHSWQAKKNFLKENIDVLSNNNKIQGSIGESIHSLSQLYRNTERVYETS